MNDISEGISLSDKRLIEARMVLDQFVVTLDGVTIPASFPSIIEAIMKCEGKIVTTAMGKAGTCIKNFSSLLCSFGFPSCYLHPGEASHGDLGIISKQDVLFVCSVSGKTREVLETIDLAKKIGVSKIIGITSHADSPIRKKADLILDMGPIREAGHLNIAPTSSIMVMTALMNCIVMVCAKEKQVTLKEYGQFHHGGYIGEKARRDSKR